MGSTQTWNKNQPDEAVISSCITAVNSNTFLLPLMVFPQKMLFFLLPSDILCKYSNFTVALLMKCLLYEEVNLFRSKLAQWPGTYLVLLWGGAA